ncbi:1-deoxy-D-xylulose-5-phosphate reductoisomerase [Kordiimonas sp. SCSIO 12610]|uniref:1-deoxy-D-xylulose-5-phosphate reductoisomerase n=1 Tax=Kordiimonas sp. SCSIO 12610 TaxID=2829597 RepID=UPI00210865FB|nr:1-deoxy-D-xylulose-5-phosphate reductoisomerase [Kordiimonas sp. SCSIO 12610]UTW54050.1 1-deoxy-D-xylulose-5-phosphate reductoisomerase [Kordiimonas sp. SCSIO 12610]
MTKRQTISILGSTGSIGLSTVDIIQRHPNRFEVVGLTANQNLSELVRLAKALNAKYAAIGNEALYAELKEVLSGTSIIPLAGEAGICEVAEANSDIVMSAIVGAAGLKPTLQAIRRGATIALANKECLVCAGDLMLEEVNRYGSKLLPVDSEHNAIFQVFDQEHASDVERIILTASGGPFLNQTIDELTDVTPEQAVAHPNWDMGAKISVDSATMMNKGLEMIEAYYLFPVNRDQVDVIVHPQSVIHSMVEYVDGSVLAQMGTPDMRTPISYCLGWPDRLSTGAKGLDFATLADLTFVEPDYAKFRCLGLARESLINGGTMPAAMNAANEVAVDAFLNRNIGFLDIACVVEKVLEKFDMKAPQSLANVYEIDKQARIMAHEAIACL